MFVSRTILVRLENRGNLTPTPFRFLYFYWNHRPSETNNLSIVYTYIPRYISAETVVSSEIPANDSCRETTPSENLANNEIHDVTKTAYSDLTMQPNVAKANLLICLLTDASNHNLKRAGNFGMLVCAIKWWKLHLCNCRISKILGGACPPRAPKKARPFGPCRQMLACEIQMPSCSKF